MERVTKGFIESIILEVDNRLEEMDHLFDVKVLE